MTKDKISSIVGTKNSPRGVWNTFLQKCRNYDDLLKRLLITFFILFLFRLCLYIRMPGIEFDKSTKDLQASPFFNLISLIGGGLFEHFSILALGVSPYITASIIVQLLSNDLIPVLTRWQKSGEKERRKLEVLTRIITIPFAIVQGLAMIFSFKNYGVTLKWDKVSSLDNPVWFYYLLVPLLLVVGTLFTLWIADQITEKGIGNGVSLIIATGILARIPSEIKITYSTLSSDLFKFFFYLLLFLFIMILIIIFNNSERRIPIQQTGGGLVEAKKLNYLPFKVNSAGVIPVIFSSALITAPMTISAFVKNAKPENAFSKFIDNYFAMTNWIGILIFTILTIAFTFIYAQIQINPFQLAENFRKSGTYLVGVRPGKMTEVYVSRLITRISVFGALFLAFVSALPLIFTKVFAESIFGTNTANIGLKIGGTGLIIVVGVLIDFYKQIRARVVQHRFLKGKYQTSQINKKTNDNFKEKEVFW